MNLQINAFIFETCSQNSHFGVARVARQLPGGFPRPTQPSGSVPAPEFLRGPPARHGAGGEGASSSPPIQSGGKLRTDSGTTGCFRHANDAGG